MSEREGTCPNLRVSNLGFDGPSPVEKLSLILGSFPTLLFSVLVIGVGALGRLMADWADLQT